MRQILLLFLLLPSWSRAHYLTAAQSVRLCETLLQTAKAEVVLPLNPHAISKILTDVFYIGKIGGKKNKTPLSDPEVQSYVVRVVEQLSGHRDPSVRELGRAFSPLFMREAPGLTVVNRENLPRGEVADIESHLNNELRKLPQGLLRNAQSGGRTLYVTFGAITQAPMMWNMRGVIPRGWDKSWDHIPGAGGGRMGAVVDAKRLPFGQGHGALNLTLHEVLHNLDYACRDLTGLAISDRPGFLHIWNESDFRTGDDYMENYSEESFAEFGSWYYDSPRSREMLRDLYPHWFNFFAQLKDCVVN